MSSASSEFVHSSTIDQNAINDPFYLHHSDNPGTNLVSQVLTGENYGSWSRAMLIYLSVKNKIDFIDGSLPKPSLNDPVRLKLWTRNNNIVISWILNSISKEIYASVNYLQDAYEIWNELRERFQQSNGPRIFQINQNLMNLIQGQDSVSMYFTNLKVLWEELANYNAHCTCGKCTCGGAKEIEHTITFLMGLNDSYSQIRGQILLMDPLPSVNRIFSLIVQEERQRDVGINQVQNSHMAFNVQSQSYSTNNKNRSNGNPTYRNQNRNQSFCTHCKKSGHTQDKCYRLHGFPPGYKFINSSSNTRANSAIATTSINDSSTEDGVTHTNDVTTGLTNAQCQHLIALLSVKLASTNIVTTSDKCSDFEPESDWQS